MNSTHAEHRLIVSVPSEGVLELNRGVGGVQGREILEAIPISGQSHSLNNQDFNFIHRRVWLFGTVIIGQNTKFTREFQVIF